MYIVYVKLFVIVMAHGLRLLLLITIFALVVVICNYAHQIIIG